MNKRILVAFVTVLLLAIALVGCGKNESDKAANTDAKKILTKHLSKSEC